MPVVREARRGRAAYYMVSAARAARKAAEAASSTGDTPTTTLAPVAAIKKSKRKGKQARERLKAGEPIRPTPRPFPSAATTSGTVPSDKWPSKLREKWYKCIDCYKDAVWTVDQQELFKSQGFDYIMPKRCPGCMRAKKARYGEGRDSRGPTHCFNCGKNGHKSRDCPSPRRTDLVCFSCGKPGHVASRCPEVQGGVPCFHCGQIGHYASECTESAKAGVPRAPPPATE